MSIPRPPGAPRGDFDNTKPAELVVGKVYGLRSFHSVTSNKLGAMVQRYTFKKGENVAVHMLDGVPAATNSNHKVAGTGCSCGFYAYYSKTSDVVGYHGACYGVIEAWGRVCIGNLGFRAEKARIVALIPAAAHVKSNVQANKFQQQLARWNYRTAVMFLLAGMLIAVATGWAISVKLLSISLWFLFCTVPLQLAIAWNGGRLLGRQLNNVRELLLVAKNSHDIEKFANHYDVPVIASFEEAIKKFNIGDRPPSH